MATSRRRTQQKRLNRISRGENGGKGSNVCIYVMSVYGSKLGVFYVFFFLFFFPAFSRF